MMNTATIKRRLNNASSFDLMINSPARTDNGMKISIQGKSIEDSIFLYSRLADYLMMADIPFKVATANRYALRDANKEQSYKAMTIYLPNGEDFFELCEGVYLKIMDYSGWRDIKTPSSYHHYAGGLFYRNDRNKNGQYVPAL